MLTQEPPSVLLCGLNRGRQRASERKKQYRHAERRWQRADHFTQGSVSFELWVLTKDLRHPSLGFNETPLICSDSKPK